MVETFKNIKSKTKKGTITMYKNNKLTAFSLILTLLITPLLALVSANPTKVSAGVNQCTWTGGGSDNNWSTDANWVCSVGTGPDTGYDLIFPFSDFGGAAEVINNDLPAANEYAGFWFTGDGTGCSGNSAYWITGNDIQLAGDILSQQTGDCFMNHRFETNLIFTADAIVSANESNPIYTGFSIGEYATEAARTINIGANTVEFLLTSIDRGVTISGSGDVTLSGPSGTPTSKGFSGVNNSTGDLIIENLELTNYSGDSLFGTGAGTTFVNNNAALFFSPQNCTGSPVDVTTSETITFNGTGPSGFNSKIGGNDCGTSTPASTFYWDLIEPGFDITLNGTINLNSELRVKGRAENFNINGAINGAYEIVLNPLYTNEVGALNINGSPNNSSTSNGTYQNSNRSITLSDSLPGETIGIIGGYVVNVTGTRGDVYIENFGVLGGDGSVGNVTSSSGILRPGLSPGIISTGNLVFDSDTVVDIELEGTTPGASGHDQFDVTGTVDLGSATLNTILFNGYVPNSIGDSYTIINNNGTDAVTGTFNGLAEGATLTSGSTQFTISYVGGDGNDVVLTVTYIPGPPGTGFGVLKKDFVIPAIILTAGVAMFAYANRRQKKLQKR